MKRKIKNFVNNLRSVVFNRPKLMNLKSVTLYKTTEDDAKVEEIIRRVHYFDAAVNVQVSNALNLKKHIDFNLIGLVDGNADVKSKLILKKDQVFDFDYDSNALEGWEFHRLLANLNYKLVAKAVEEGQQKLIRLKDQLSKKYDKAYIFGTGPSLEKAIERDWSDGIRIVSNTIVKDAELWNKINPHIIVACDGIYHFGAGKFPESFRQDLKERLKETDTYFIFPDIFYPFCLKELAEHKDKLIPVPYGYSPLIHHDLTVDYAIPTGDNVLPMLLLPVAATLSKNVFLWGFDGRSPNDKLFWKNSSKHFYPEHVDELMILHPAFYNKNVPKGSPESYAKKVHGDSLDNSLKEAEKVGFVFKMMHFSYTKILQDRGMES